MGTGSARGFPRWAMIDMISNEVDRHLNFCGQGFPQGLKVSGGVIGLGFCCLLGAGEASHLGRWIYEALVKSVSNALKGSLRGTIEVTSLSRYGRRRVF